MYLQYKYRIQAHHHAAAVDGAHGHGVAIDAQFNGLINDKGCVNTNKAGDLKVCETKYLCNSNNFNFNGFILVIVLVCLYVLVLDLPCFKEAVQLSDKLCLFNSKFSHDFDGVDSFVKN